MSNSANNYGFYMRNECELQAGCGNSNSGYQLVIVTLVLWTHWKWWYKMQIMLNAIKFCEECSSGNACSFCVSRFKVSDNDYCEEED